MAVSQLKAGAFLNYVVILLNLAVGLLYTPYMLRMMGQSEYGLYSLVASVIGYLTVLDLGMGNATIRYTAKFRAEGKKKEQYEMFGMFLVIYLFIGIIAVIAGLGLYFNVDNMFGATMTPIELYHARIMMLILVFNLAVSFPMSIFGSIITAYERFVFPKVVNIVRIILNTAIMVVLLSMGYKAIAMVVLSTAFNVITLIINYVYCKRKLHIEIHWGHFEWGFIREVAIYSFWILLNVLMDRIYWSTGQFVLGAVSGTIAVSIFAVAIQLEGMYMMFSTAIVSVFLPKVTGLVTKGSQDREISDLFIRTGRIQSIIMSLILFGFIAFGQEFIILWAGPDYADAYYMALMIFVALYIPVIQNLGVTILQARNQMRFRSILYVCIALLALVAEFVFAKQWGGIGCAMAISGALLLGQGLIMNIYYQRVQHLNIISFWKQVIKMNLMPISVTALSLFITHTLYVIDTWPKLVMGIAVFTAMYIPLCWNLSMNQYERNLITKPILNTLRR